MPVSLAECLGSFANAVGVPALLMHAGSVTRETRCRIRQHADEHTGPQDKDAQDCPGNPFLAAQSAYLFHGRIIVASRCRAMTRINFAQLKPCGYLKVKRYCG